MKHRYVLILAGVALIAAFLTCFKNPKAVAPAGISKTVVSSERAAEQRQAQEKKQERVRMVHSVDSALAGSSNNRVTP